MKIAIYGNQDDKIQEVINKFIDNWTNYKCPSDNIHNTNYDWETKIQTNSDLKKLYDKFNDTERELYGKITLLREQMEKFKDNNYIIINGSPIDVLVHTILASEYDMVSDDFTAKIIYNVKKYIKYFDLIFWLPWQEQEAPTDEDTLQLETIFSNLYDSYVSDFNNLPFFDHDDCPAITKLETYDQISEMKVFIDKNGNIDNEEDMMDVDKLLKNLKGVPQLEQLIKDKMNIKNGGISSINSGYISI